MKKRILSLLLLAVMLVSMVGCAKIISTEYETVEVTIIDEYHRGARVMPMRVGNITTMRTQPAVYRIVIAYNDVEYTINGREIYNQYKDKVGSTTLATLKICTYDNGNTRSSIVELK